MEIENIDGYKDGGTIKIVTPLVTYCIDNRLRSTTKGDVYMGYPEKDNSNRVILLQEEVKIDILRSIEDYEDTFHDWRPAIRTLLNR